MMICFAAMIFASELCFGSDDFFVPPYHYTAFGGAGITNHPDNINHGDIHVGGSMEMMNAVDFKYGYHQPAIF
jgi:hypothetical protein